ncbi:phosphate ABC transporter substrate-binding protein PstS [Spirochaeta africana]|uniref:Phosphate-binding protein n=1 Tax=Spirochaeta africana (strain ATCC 700263 / DSM 8902 / Z-7692) TaxID=889378 RepID=H9UGU1_SPIAZ|nr:phosphate ABC transporter substrate-binding protein PstS [Spirochaeta africana]AFG36734.1 phosphate ABC transporter, phosphate-binding protein [Spirochaeta africana DSM 8902]
MKTIRVLTIALLALALTMPAFAAGQQEGAREARHELLGAGASFPAPLITAWADEYRDVTNGQVTVNYQSIGSGGGIRQFIEQNIMFGASERSLTDEQMDDALRLTGGVAYNMPITLGDIVLTYNVPGVDKGLVMDADVIAGAFLGEITRWNDSKIAALNPDVDLPNLPIQIAHRSDGSGSTAIFTDYLTKTNSTWADRVGFGSSVNWPTGSGGNGNEGVAGIVQSTPGALGYNSLVYAVLNDIDYAYIVNKSGNIIEPSLEATSLAAAVELPADGRVSLTDTPAPQGYPIAGFAWALVYENLDQNAAITSRAEAEQVAKFLYWTVTDGQDLNEGLSFARLPDDAQALAVQMISTLKYNGEPVGQQVIDQVQANGF